MAWFSVTEYQSPVPSWSIEAWCANQPTPQESTADDEPTSTRMFFELLNLSRTEHPFCVQFNDTTYPLPNVPPQGPLLQHDHLETVWDVIVTTLALTLPPLWAMLELWLRLLAAAIAPLGLTHLLYLKISSSTHYATKVTDTAASTTPTTKQGRNYCSSNNFTSIVCHLTVASSLVLLTDTLYVQEFGWRYGAALLAMSSWLSLQISQRLQLRKTYWGVFLLLAWTLRLVYDSGRFQLGAAHEHYTFSEGLYYDDNPYHHNIVKHWPIHKRTYGDDDATPWMPTGDSRTGLPFLLHKDQVPTPHWHRVWLPVENGEEVVALDIAFPTAGHSTSKPIYMVLHGLNGGSQEEYVKEFAQRRTAEGSTVVVMVARGLMDLPVRGWHVFHGARWQDAHHAAQALRKTVMTSNPNQLLAGVGYSMGGIILANMVARTGRECALDVAVSISGGLDMRHELQAYRAMRLWQPLLTGELRQTFVVGKWGERVRARLSKPQMKALMRGTHITDIDRTAVVAYNGFRDVEHYYSEMSLLGDMSLADTEGVRSNADAVVSQRLHNVSVPLLVVHALDDPLITWRTVAANHGPMHPKNLTAGKPLFMLLTKRGGHVGWPVGWLPTKEKWRWMSDVSSSFVEAVADAHRIET